MKNMKKDVKALTRLIDVTRFFVAILIVISIILGIQTSEAFSFREMSLKFAQLSDTHITDRADTSYKMLSGSKQFLEDAIEQLNEIKDLDFVVFTGDMVDTPTVLNYEGFFALTNELKHPYIFSFGNHDFAADNYASANVPGLSKSCVLNMAKESAPNMAFQKPWYAFSPKKDFRVIVLDLTIDERETSNGRISQEQLNFLSRELQEHPDKIIIIFHHMPVVQPFHAETHKVLNADEYLSTISEFKNPILIFSGHYHTTKIIRNGNTIHVSTPSMVTYPNAFRVVNIISYADRAVFDFDFRETRLGEMQSKCKSMTLAPSAHVGTEKDRVVTITLNKNKSDSSKKTKKQQ
ncbi:3',5'-cyclic AMP phosphodiesterase CpdA [Candidatus Gastranaerophilus sp. (ex Termes propinquus)]|nr:3',5'-cyclic AMP phosphodiesterase CpdA [Candidatus Gastranaerophilus sp. (ex Termes propinquus)]